MSWKAGFGLAALGLCLVTGPWDGPRRTVPTPVSLRPMPQHVALQPLPPGPVGAAQLLALAPAVHARHANRRISPTRSAWSHQAVQLVRAPGRRAGKPAPRHLRHKSPYAIGKVHYPYVRPRAWGPGYPVA